MNNKLSLMVLLTFSALAFESAFCGNNARNANRIANMEKTIATLEEQIKNESLSETELAEKNASIQRFKDKIKTLESESSTTATTETPS